MQEIDDVGFDKLRLGQRRSNAQNRLVREEHGAFRHGVDVSTLHRSRAWQSAQAKVVALFRSRGDAILINGPTVMLKAGCSPGDRKWLYTRWQPMPRSMMLYP